MRGTMSIEPVDDGEVNQLTIIHLSERARISVFCGR